MFRYHNTLKCMHFGINKTIENLLSVCWWPNMRQHVSDHIKECISCAAVKDPCRKTRVPMRINMASYPLQRVATNIAGPFPVSRRGNQWAICFIDHFTKYCYIIAAREERDSSQNIRRGMVDKIRNVEDIPIRSGRQLHERAGE